MSGVRVADLIALGGYALALWTGVALVGGLARAVRRLFGRDWR